MKVVILAGGYGTRISEESYLRPKPMIEIGEQPILWHIMKSYSYYGFNDFIICLGYKGYMVKEYFADYYLHTSDITFDFRKKNEMTIHNNVAEPWRVTLVDTGLHTQTGGRLSRVKQYLDRETFMLTYGDGVSDVNITDLLKFHHSHGKLATITAIQPGGRFGVLEIAENSSVQSFREKAQEDGGWVNGGFMVLEPGVLDYVSSEENCVFEQQPLNRLSEDGQLVAYKYNGFWQCMDTQRDKSILEKRWIDKNAPWKVWPG